MDSKKHIPLFINDDNSIPPPSYPEAISNTSSQFYSIQSQLASLVTQFSSLLTQISLFPTAKDEKILSLLTTQIQIYLSDFAKTELQKGTLILVPAAALDDENAVPMEYDFRDEGEYDKVVRVGNKADQGYDGNSGTEMWFWKDKELAGRLAEYLELVGGVRTRELPPREKMAEREESGNSRGFGGRKRNSKSVEWPLFVEERRDSKAKTDSETKNVRIEDKVLMDVKVEEVSFRTENEFVVFGTERGFVLKIRVVLG